MDIFGSFANFFSGLFGGDDKDNSDFDEDITFEFESALDDVEISLSSGSVADLNDSVERLEAIADELGIDFQTATPEDVNTLVMLEGESELSSDDFESIISHAESAGIDFSTVTEDEIQDIAQTMTDEDIELDPFIQFAEALGFTIENPNDYEAARELFYENEYQLASTFSALDDALAYVEGVSQGVLEIVPRNGVYEVYRTYKD